jgi:hypothetical protein
VSRIVKSLWVILLVGGAALAAAAPARAIPVYGQLMAIPLVAFRATTGSGETFAQAELVVNETSLTPMTYLSGSPSGSYEFAVDDQIDISVTRPDGTTEAMSHNFRSDGNCGKLI